MWEGIDLKGDEGEFVIIATAPFIPKSQKRNARVAAKIQLAGDTEWWLMRCAFKLMQGVGRCSRSKDDYSRTYILDDGFCEEGNSNLLEWLENNHPELPDAFVNPLPL